MRLKEIKQLPPFINTLKGVVIGFLITVIVFIVYAIVLTYTNITEQYIPLVVTITTIIAVVVAGYDAAKGVPAKGWLWGMLAGLIYALVIIIIGVLVSEKAKIGMSSLVTLIMSVGAGGLGGMIGINVKK